SVSVGGLFAAGILPGLLLTAAFIVTTMIIVRMRGYLETTQRYSFSEILREVIRSLPILLMPVIVLGGIMGGIFTATEAAAVAVVYALFIGFVITRELKFSDLAPSLL